MESRHCKIEATYIKKGITVSLQLGLSNLRMTDDMNLFLATRFPPSSLIDLMKLNDKWRPSPRRLSKKAGYLNQQLNSQQRDKENRERAGKPEPKRIKPLTECQLSTFHAYASADDVPILSLLPEDLFPAQLGMAHKISQKASLAHFDSAFRSIGSWILCSVDQNPSQRHYRPVLNGKVTHRHFFLILPSEIEHTRRCGLVAQTVRAGEGPTWEIEPRSVSSQWPARRPVGWRNRHSRATASGAINHIIFYFVRLHLTFSIKEIVIHILQGLELLRTSFQYQKVKHNMLDSGVLTKSTTPTFRRSSQLKDNVAVKILPTSLSNMHSGLAIKTKPNAWEVYIRVRITINEVAKGDT
ncbi:hypothetical protein Cgig2_025587 [Carnegiea gigantea]|uniref:Uncharacterized protein n=1 Tax=Carnegiea gigantea TaxID=171969 RepID=A0A9Q1JR52_9CARY|nr:hypothetical protein Cgig2_025587 [Carnegiea gigantea]